MALTRGEEDGSGLDDELDLIGAHRHVPGFPTQSFDRTLVAPPPRANPAPLVLRCEQLPARLGVLCAACNARKGLSRRRR